MSASIDEYLEEAANTLYALNADEEVRKRCRDRLEYYQDLKNYERKIEQNRLAHEQTLAARDQTIAAQEEQIRLLLAENERLKQKK